MTTPSISISFSKYNDANVETKAQHILASMTGNPNFTHPAPSIGTVEAALAAYSSAKVAAEGLGKNNVAAKNKARKAMEALFTELGRYVMFAANGDEAALISSGYPLRKNPEPQHLQPVGNVTLSNGITAGQMVSAVKKPKGSKGFIHEISAVEPGENTVWTSTATSRSRHIFTNLQPGRQYWVRVAATGSNMQIAYSTVASQFAQ